MTHTKVSAVSVFLVTKSTNPMKKVLFICTAAALCCSACDWFGGKPSGNDNGQSVVTTDSLSTNPDTAMAEAPGAGLPTGAPEAEHEEKDEKDSK